MTTAVRPIEGIGLRTGSVTDRVALRGIAVRSRLTPAGHRTSVEQTFVNLEPRPIEAVYTFPLPDGAAVCGLEVVTGDRVLTGVAEEVQRAIGLHEDAIAAGHGSTLLEAHRPDVFSVGVGNLKPGQAATIRVEYVAEVPIRDRTLRLVFPTTLAPRYATATGSDPVQAEMDADALNPPHVLRVPYGLTLEAELDLRRPVRGVASPSHPLRVEREAGGLLRVRLAEGIAATDRDVVLVIELEAEPAPMARVERGPDGALYAAVSLVPELAWEGPPPASDVVFLLDCSGSMRGESIAQAKAALALCLRALSLGDTFNLCRFGSTHKWKTRGPGRTASERWSRWPSGSTS